VVEHVAAGFEKCPKVREHYAAAQGLLGPKVVFDAAQVGSRAHRLWAWWTNLEGPLCCEQRSLPRSDLPGFLHHVLGRGKQAKPPQTTGTASWECVTVEKPGQPVCALNTFVSYGGSYVFSRGGGGVLRCSNPAGRVTWEEPTAEEPELAMGFPRGFTQAKGQSEATWRDLLGQAMDLDALMWLLGACKEGGRCRVSSPQLGGDGRQGSMVTKFEAGVPVGATAIRATGVQDSPPVQRTGRGPTGSGPAREVAAGGGVPVGVAGERASGGPDSPPVQGTGWGLAGTGPVASVFTIGGVADRGTPGGWRVGAQLGETEKQQVAAVAEKNRDVFAFSLDEPDRGVQVV
jgi:hypothetical protein